MNLDEAIDRYFAAKKEVHEALGYQGDWAEIPLDDCREMYWMLVGGEQGRCVWSDEPFTEASVAKGEKIYSGEVYTQRHLSKWVYRTPTHVAICVDTNTDGNKFLMVFDATKECTDEAMREAYRDHW